MRELGFAEAIEDALAHAMAADERVVVFGEDAPGLRMNLYARFGEARVRPALWAAPVVVPTRGRAG